MDVSLKNLEKRLYEIIEHILLLSDYRVLTDAEINVNNVAFQWYHKMPEILEENEVIVANKTIEFQDALKGVRNEASDHRSECNYVRF